MVGVALLLVGAIVGSVIAVTVVAPRTPSDDSPEAGFARDMQVHHAQAVEMALMIRDKTSDPTLRAVSYDIITSQQQQIGQMFAFLNSWNLSQTSSSPPMAWMSGARMPMGPDGQMPGMASARDMKRLAAATGRPAERLFLRLMIRHHQAGIAMAKAVIDASDRADVETLASSIVTSQRAEILQMQQLLAARQGQAR